MYKQNIIKIALVSNVSKIGDVNNNLKEIINAIKEAKDHGASLIAFPELAITGYNILDLVNQDYLYEDNLNALKEILEYSDGVLIDVNTYIRDGENTYIASILLNNKKVLGVVPKTCINKSINSFEQRYFSEFNKDIKFIKLFGQSVPFGKMIFASSDGVIRLGLESANEYSSLDGVSSKYFKNGANIIINSNYSVSCIEENDRIDAICKTKSILSNACYLLTTTHSSLTSSEEVPSGLIIGYNDGLLVLKDEDVLGVDTKICYCDIDLGSINYKRRTNGFKAVSDLTNVEFDISESLDFAFEGEIDKSPFLNLTNEDYLTIINTQARSIINRLNYIGTKKTVIGVSGGLDSTLAILCLAHAYDLMGWDRKDIYAITLPTKNTSSRTYSSANSLMDNLNVSKKEIAIGEDVERELKAINHPLDVKDTTYENIQARFRTYTLMNTANNIGGIVVGTSDMSEVALGWSTFNGDQMAMYGVNASIPKTLIREVCRRYKEILPEVKEAIDDVINTPISPELTGNQLTEDIIGKYEINDFILYHMIGNGASYEKLVFLITKAFGLSIDHAKEYVTNFNKRMYHQQFKRLTMPEAVRVLRFSLSPRSNLLLSGDIVERK